MRENSNLEIKVSVITLFCIISILSLIVVYQARTINKLRSNQTSEFFLETKLRKEQMYSNTLNTLKTLIDDKNVSQENRNEAASKYINLALAANYESKIEAILKSKGYEDVIASISDDKVRVIIKYDKKLNNKQVSQISDIVKSITGISNIETEIKS